MRGTARGSWGATLALSCGLAVPGPALAECPAALDTAQQVLLVTTAGMASVKASIRRFARPQPGAVWHEEGSASPAVVGATGLGWAPDAVGVATGEPHKQEGDKRTPAGFFPMGRIFGAAPSALPGYMRLEPGQEICVDDPASPHYGQIVTRRDDPKAHGEDMGRVSLYRRGVVIDYPVDASRRSGSCIFLHVWRAAAKGTVGCVALPEPAVAVVQSWIKPGAMIGVLPRREADKFLACLAGKP